MSTCIISQDNTHVDEIKTKYQDRDIIWFDFSCETVNKFQ